MLLFLLIVPRNIAAHTTCCNKSFSKFTILETYKNK